MNLDEHMQKVRDDYCLEIFYWKTHKLDEMRAVLDTGEKIREEVFLSKMSELIGIDKKHLDYHEQYFIYNNSGEFMDMENDKDCHQVVLSIKAELEINKEFFEYIKETKKTSIMMSDWTHTKLTGKIFKKLVDEKEYKIWFSFISNASKIYTPNIQSYFEDGTFNEEEMLKNINYGINDD